MKRIIMMEENEYVCLLELASKGIGTDNVNTMKICLHAIYESLENLENFDEPEEYNGN
jgi:hypothetical protein